MVRGWNQRIKLETFSLLGGEPTLHPQLPRFVELARKWWPKSRLRLVTNGWFLHRHPELPRILRDDPDAVVYLSVHDNGPEYREKLRPITKLLQQWIADYGITVHSYQSFRYWTRRYHGIGASMKPYDDGNPRQSWENCSAKIGMQLFDGNIWKCAPLAYLGMQNARHGLSENWRPYLQYQPLKPDCSDRELNEFLDREEESCCAMCPAQPEQFRPRVGIPNSAARRKDRQPAAASQNLRDLVYFSMDVAMHQPSVAPRYLSSRVVSLDVPAVENRHRGWRPCPLFRGASQSMQDIACHVSRLQPRITPHAPHRHEEEEILIMLTGEAQLEIVNPSRESRRHALRPGSFVFYPAGQLHTLHNPGPEDATYLMFKWRGHRASAAQTELETQVLDLPIDAEPLMPGGRGFQPRRVLEGPTGYLPRLHVHRTTLHPGAGYRPHADPYDVALVLLEGNVETLGQRLSPMSMAWYGAGQPHGIRNPGKTPAVYLVFEFHGGGVS